MIKRTNQKLYENFHCYCAMNYRSFNYKNMIGTAEVDVFFKKQYIESNKRSR